MELTSFNISQDIPQTIRDYISQSNLFCAFKQAVTCRMKHFIYDLENYRQINYLIAYFARKPNFEGQSSKQILSLSKGICLIGNTGSGKTELMQAFRGLVRNMEHAFILKPANALNYEEWIGLNTKNFCIDDLGKEDKVGVFGVQKDYMSDLIFARYNEFKSYGTITHFTTQLSEAQISERYGAHILGRIKEMCNIFVLGDKDNYTDRRVKATPFIAKSPVANDFPLFFPNYITEDKRKDLEMRMDMQKQYEKLKEEAQKEAEFVENMNDAEAEQLRLASLMERYLNSRGLYKTNKH